MKRWQDCGEVADSDDEELSLEHESQSPEQVRKRPRLDYDLQDVDTVTARVSFRGDADASSDGDGETEEPWLQPKAATTYSRRVKAVEVFIPKRTSSPSQPQGRSRRSPSPDPILQTGNDDLAENDIGFPTQPEQMEDGHAGPSSLQSSASDELPSLSQLISTRTGKRKEAAVEIPSAASSPLSERSVSPPTDFLLSRLDANVNVFGSADQAFNEEVSTTEEDASLAQLQAETNAAARRQLRTRKEKQLHPYEYEKALYHQQMRQRGLKPIRLVTHNQHTSGTQDQAYSGDESQSQQRPGNRPLSPPRFRSESREDASVTANADTGTNGQAPNTDEEFPDIDTLINRNSRSAVQSGQKRRKLFHVSKHGTARGGKTFAPQSHRHGSQQDEFSVPPSPPPTSSDSAMQGGPKALPSGFRLPYGVTPQALPTPDLSSDVRPLRGANDPAASDSDSDDVPRNSRTPAMSRLQSRAQVIESSTESESDVDQESEPAPEVDDRGLQRERKRIRGVLPASWLKIEFHAQQRRTTPSSPRTSRSDTASAPPPLSTRPQKGIAQRVSKTSITPARDGPITISDAEDDTDDEATAPSPQALQQPRLHSDRGLLNSARGTFVDNNQMEVDWVDPMLAGSSRRRREETFSESKKRQPRIQDAFARARAGGNDFAEKRAGLQHILGPAKSRKRRSTHAKRQPRTPRASAPALSILDAPSSISETSVPMPLFVRLAQRQARQQTEKGRHSPSRKVIRLATKDDTDEAFAILRRWREGTLLAKPLPHAPADCAHHEDDDGSETPKGDQSAFGAREPLSELHNNPQHQLPSSLSKEAGHVKTQLGRRINVQRLKPRRTRLQPIVLDRRPHTEQDITIVGERTVDGVVEGSRRPQRYSRPEAQGLRLRGAQHETLEDSFVQEHRRAAFEHRVNFLTEAVAARARVPQSRALPLECFLEPTPAPRIAMRFSTQWQTAHSDQVDPSRQQGKRQTLHYRPRKRQAQRVNAEARQYRQPSEPLPDVTVTDQPQDDVQTMPGPVLLGLGSFGLKYAVDFDIQPLALGTYFHQSTFIGSGDFAASFKLAQRDLSVVTGRMRVHVNDEVLEWGAWTENVATGIARITRAVSEAIHTLSGLSSGTELEEQSTVVISNVDHMLRSTIRYSSKCLAFLDPIDRRACIHHLQRFVEDLVEALTDLPTDNGLYGKLRTRCLQYALVAATQALSLSQHDLVVPETKLRSHSQVSDAARKLAFTLLPSGLEGLRAFYEESRHSPKREAGIREDDGPIATMVILHHCLHNADAPRASFWDVINEAFGTDLGQIDTAPALDKVWYDIHSVLPALEVDESGIARPGSRLRNTEQDWTLVKGLVDRILELYPATSVVRGSTVNDYVRATMTRCYRLVSRWGWWKCESILGTIFDFFARRGLAPLHNERPRGSPLFLEELANQPSLEVQAEDRTFHVFLKTLAVGLQGMRKYSVYDDKKIGGIAWRFIPNHGRTYQKDAVVKQTDLEALRNHHDLLSTLHYASPSGYRLRLDLVRNLIDHSTSHREACRLSVRTWANLASFQASTDEHVESLQGFMDWYQEILQTTITQYRLAKTEAELDFAVAKAQGAVGITESVLTATVASNQRQTVATLVDALAGLKRTLRTAASLPAAVNLVEGSRFWNIFTPFDASERRLFTALDEALGVAHTALDVQRKFSADSHNQQRSEDSQDYGDSSALEEFAGTQACGGKVHSNVGDLLYDSVAHLLSNVFGADISIDDALLTKIVDLWMQLAKENVRSDKSNWTSYLDDYSSNSWYQLRDTEQRRKLTPYFLGRLVDSANEDLGDLKTTLIRSWLMSLVEREAMLKYQHVLTATLLNNVNNEPLLDNLPFSKDTRSGMFSISLQDLRQRRLALISSVLSNMREHFDETVYTRPQRLNEVRRTYTDILKAVMQAMKDNYQELQTSTSTTAADPSLQGAYVEFVQRVVSSLQQHTADVCRVDPFFTDSSAFPLPATDPTYVVGRLKGYVPKLAESRTRKQLTMFMLTVSERAAVDNQQEYLVDQLCSSMDGVLERGDNKAPSLLHVMLTAIFPAYIENALTTACSWILALPVLQASANTLLKLLYNVKLDDGKSLAGIDETIRAVVDSLSKPFELALVHPGLLRLPHVQRVLCLVFECGRSLLTLCDHLKRSTSHGETHVRQLSGLCLRGREVLAYLGGVQGTILDPAIGAEHKEVLWADTRTFAQQQLRDTFENRWHAHDGQYFVRMGNSSKEVVVGLEDDGEEQLQMLASIERYCKSFEAIVDGQARMRTAALHDSCGTGGVMV